MGKREIVLELLPVLLDLSLEKLVESGVEVEEDSLDVLLS